MINQKNSFIWFKINGLLRTFLVHCCSDFFPLYIVNEYPKSGGSWVGQMLSKALNVPFPRNRMPVFRSSIMHGHFMTPWNMKNVLIVWRDGRDQLISQYYHSLFENDKGNTRLVKQVRGEVNFTDYGSIKKNLPAFIQYAYENKHFPKFSWSDFVSVWHKRKDCCHVKYENLRYNTVVELQRIVMELTDRELPLGVAQAIADEFSFENQSGRKPGQENQKSFMRKGIIGDWKNHFDSEAKKLFAHYAGEELIKLGYEKDYSWLDD